MTVSLPPDLMVSVSGFRGLVGRPLTPELVTGVAAAFGSFLLEEARQEGGPDDQEGTRGSVLVGRDSRTSGPLLARAVSAGLESVGVDVVDLGLVPTPSLLLAVREGGALGGVGVTASHNPAEWNALKLSGSDGMFLDALRMERFLRSLRERDPVRAPWDGLGGVRSDEGAVDRHLERILALSQLDVPGIRDRRFHVALDCVHGAGGTILPSLLEELGCRVEGIGLETDGRFPRDPEPRADNLAALGDLVRRTGAELGFAVDPDVDRLSLVDGHGEAPGEDVTLAVAAAAVLNRTPGVVVTNLSTSRIVEDVVSGAGGRLVRAPVGEINVARKMQEVGAVIGGEGNGGIILPALHVTRDAAVGTALVLQFLLDSGNTLADTVAGWPGYHIVKDKASFPRDRLDAAYRALRVGPEAFPAGPEALRAGPEGMRMDEQDGLRMDWPEQRAWVHVRPSGTEPVVRIIAEAPELEEARRLVRWAGAVVAEAGAAR